MSLECWWCHISNKQLKYLIFFQYVQYCFLGHVSKWKAYWWTSTKLFNGKYASNSTLVLMQVHYFFLLFSNFFIKTWNSTWEKLDKFWSEMHILKKFNCCIFKSDYIVISYFMLSGSHCFWPLRYISFSFRIKYNFSKL